jgi:hypothetical protein
MNEIVGKLHERLGSGCITDQALADSYLTDWRGLLRGQPACVLRPNFVNLLSRRRRCGGVAGRFHRVGLFAPL